MNTTDFTQRPLLDPKWNSIQTPSVVVCPACGRHAHPATRDGVVEYQHVVERDPFAFFGVGKPQGRVLEACRVAVAA